MNLDDWRKEIDDVDSEIVSLLARRVQIAREISRLKQISGAPIRDRERETKIFDRVRGLSGGTVEPRVVDRVYKAILSESRRMQAVERSRELGIADDCELKKVAIQGAQGSYSEAAAHLALGANIEILGCDTFDEAFALLRSGVAEAAVIPRENSIVGEIGSTCEHLKAADLKAVDSVKVEVRHVLAGIPDARIENITHIYSHREALRQCGSFLRANPQFKSVETVDTAASIRDIVWENDGRAAAICSESAARLYGGVILQRDIADDRDNFTTFVVLENATR
ncbi:MAG: Prephenate dehydratase [Acidobacteria bacterium OLB17]|nr:MAG: Prephenate dehydratase [Acidobacteria bacterium OLB17]MCZ2391833.1 chorismate mutase [Acidobacteriota bacterium]